jgi:hypothetical protein
MTSLALPTTTHVDDPGDAAVLQGQRELQMPSSTVTGQQHRLVTQNQS